MKSKTNWNKLAKLTDKDIEASAKADPDASLLTDAELKLFKRVEPVQNVDVKKIRESLHISQEKFAFYFGVSKRTIQEWEQKRKRPSATSRNFLRVVQFAPNIVQQALRSNQEPF